MALIAGPKSGSRATVLLAILLVVAAPVAAQSIPGVPGGSAARARMNRAEYDAEVIQRGDELFKAWRAAWRTDDAEETAGYYTDNAMLVLPGEEAVFGREGIRQRLALQLPTVGEIQTSVRDYSASGKMGYFYGPFYYDLPNGDRVEGTHATVIFREGRDWLIRSQIFRLNPDP